MNQVSFFFFSLLVTSALGQMKICKDETCKDMDGIVGPSIDGFCPPPYVALINGICVEPSYVKTVPCDDRLDSDGETICPLSKAGCGKNFLPQFDEPFLCAKTCGYCSPPGKCMDLTMFYGNHFCTGRPASDCNSNIESLRIMMNQFCPKTCGLCS